MLENRIDYWKLDKKHAPYLFFMGIGAYEIIEDKYKNIPVNYYVEKKYASYAKDIFGNTPEIIGFFADKKILEKSFSLLIIFLISSVVLPIIL